MTRRKIKWILKFIFPSFIPILISVHLNAQVSFEFKDSGVTSWKYKDGDEFNTGTLDKNKWLTCYPWARHLYCSMDVNYYSDGEDLKMNDGILSITARKSPVTARAIPYENDDYIISCESKQAAKNLMRFTYQSGIIYSQNKYLYGHFEINFRTDAGNGLWPAFWLFGSDNQEIDIFEIGGNRKNDFHVDVHCKKGCNNYPVFMGLLRKNWGDYLRSNVSWENTFHNISITWEPSGVSWYLDGQPVAWWEGDFHEPLSLIANLAVTNKEGSMGGAIDEKTKLPANFDINYIRIWEKGNNGKIVISESDGETKPITTASSLARLVKKRKPEYKRKVLKHAVKRISVFPEINKHLSIYQEGNLSGTVHIEILPAGQSQPIITQEINSNVTSLNLTSLKQGNYLLKIILGDKEALTNLEVH